jgi:hypothetical protein
MEQVVTDNHLQSYWNFRKDCEAACHVANSYLLLVFLLKSIGVAGKIIDIPEWRYALHCEVSHRYMEFFMSCSPSIALINSLNADSWFKPTTSHSFQILFVNTKNQVPELDFFGLLLKYCTIRNK